MTNKNIDLLLDEIKRQEEHNAEEDRAFAARVDKTIKLAVAVCLGAWLWGAILGLLLR